MLNSLKRVVARMPERWQQQIKRLYFARQIRSGRFRTDEPEYDLLPGILRAGDWVLDVGANVGHYTLRCSELVGAGGRVLAFEPMPASFELLAANVRGTRFTNVSLFNAAASDTSCVLGMTVPKFDTGLTDYYRAQLSESNDGLRVLCLAADSLEIPHPVRLVKVDAEGHELAVLRGMQRLLERDHPVLIIEANDPEVPTFLGALGYGMEHTDGSPNDLYVVRSEK